MACSAALATLAAIEEESMLANVAAMCNVIKEKLNNLAAKYPVIDHVRGVGFMLGIQLNAPGADVVARCWEKGLRINCTHDTVLRFMPPLNVKTEEIDRAIAVMDEAFAESKGGASS